MLFFFFKQKTAYDIHPTGVGAGDSRISFDLDVAVPKKALLTIRNEKGDITVADMAKPVNVTNGVGDIEVRGTGGGVEIDTPKSDNKNSDTKSKDKNFGYSGGRKKKKGARRRGRQGERFLGKWAARKGERGR